MRGVSFNVDGGYLSISRHVGDQQIELHTLSIGLSEGGLKIIFIENILISVSLDSPKEERKNLKPEEKMFEGFKLDDIPRSYLVEKVETGKNDNRGRFCFL